MAVDMWMGKGMAKVGEGRPLDKFEQMAVEKAEQMDEALRQRAIEHRLEVTEARGQAKDKAAFDRRLQENGGTLGAPESYQRSLVTGEPYKMKNGTDLW